MSSRRYISRLARQFFSPHGNPRKRDAARVYQPKLDSLEDRCLLSTLYFPPKYSGESVSQYGGEVRTGDVPVYLILAGGSSSWSAPRKLVQ